MNLIFCNVIVVDIKQRQQLIPGKKSRFLLHKHNVGIIWNPNPVTCNQRRNRTFVVHRGQWLQQPATTKTQTSELGLVMDFGKTQGKCSQISLDQVEAFELNYSKGWGG